MRQKTIIVLGLLVIAGIAVWLAVRGPVPKLSSKPVSNQFEVRANDSGKTFVYTLTSRFMIVLDQTRYSPVNFRLDCDKPGVLGRISNIPASAPPFYAARFEGAAAGTCTISNNDFHIQVEITGL